MADSKEKKVSKTVSLFPSMWEWLDEEGGGNRSKPIYEFVAKSMSGEGTLPGQSENCLMELCETFAPSYAHFMAERVDGVDQRVMLESIVRLIALGQIGLRDEWTKSQWPLKAAEEGNEYNAD